ncbi:MAG: TIGR04086 family membrane protein [Clostridiales bacterium]|nr:TIGR04086 family membrane protein [Clostridiales bacterium]
MEKKKELKTNNNATLKNVVKGILISFLITVILLFIYALFLTFTNIGENTITPVIIVCTAISILIGSSIGNHKIEKNGMANGAFIGGGYILVLYLTSSLLSANFSINFKTIIMMVVGIIFGIIGGIVGVNSKK